MVKCGACACFNGMGCANYKHPRVSKGINDTCEYGFPLLVNKRRRRRRKKLIINLS
jgi:hypothetical protein